MIESEQYRREGSKYPAHYIWYFSYQGSRSIMKQLLGLAENIGMKINMWDGLLARSFKVA